MSQASYAEVARNGLRRAKLADIAPAFDEETEDCGICLEPLTNKVILRRDKIAFFILMMPKPKVVMPKDCKIIGMIRASKRGMSLLVVRALSKQSAHYDEGSKAVLRYR